MKERWKSIPGHAGYEASTLGRIRSLPRVVVRRNGAPFTVKGRIRKPVRYCASGHVSVGLGARQRPVPVHQLVLLAFRGPRPPGAECLHRNGVPTDNRPANLRYGTRGQNLRDLFLHGLRKVTAEDVRAIRRKHAEGWTQHELAEVYGVTRPHIGNIVRKRFYANV